MDRILALAVDPRNPSIVYAGTAGGGVWKTPDSGISWSPVLDSQLASQICSLAIDPGNPDVIYAGMGDDQSPRRAQGIMRSADGGRSWTSLARITDRPICALAIDPTNTSRIFAGSEEGLFISSDSGAGWARVSAFPVTSIAFDSTGTLYVGKLADDTAGARQHILSESSDGGRTWTDLPLPRNPATPGAPANWVTVATAGNDVFAAVSFQSTPLSEVDFFKSSDGGHQWSGTFDLGQVRPPMVIVPDPNGGLFFAGAGLLRSTDRGLTWTAVSTKTAGFHAAALAGTALLLGGDKGLEAVVPGGIAPGISTFRAAQILGVSIDAAGRIWAAGPSGLFGFSAAPALTQSVAGGVGSVGRVGAVGGTAGPANIYAAASNAVYYSADGGARFSSQAVIAADELRAPYPPLAVDPIVSSSAYVAGQRVYHTSNGGADWSALGTVDPDPTRVVIALAIPPASRTTLFAATACLPEAAVAVCEPVSVIWRSTNAGQTWVQMSTVAGFVNQLAIDPRQSTRVYAAIGAFPAGPSQPAGLVAGDLLLSTNAGGTWSSVRSNLPRTPINAISIDPVSLPAQLTQPAQTMFLGTDNGVFVSFDAGTRWTDISYGLSPSPVTALSLLRPDGVLVAATFGRGVYRLPLEGLTPSIAVRPLSQDVTLVQGTSATGGIVLDNLYSGTMLAWQLSPVDTWLHAPQPGGSLRPAGSSQVPVGISAANLRAGTYIGRLQLTSDYGVQNVIVEMHVRPAAAQLTIAGGDGASGYPGAVLPPLEVLALDENHEPLANAAITFTITAGGGSLSARTVLTNTLGIASVIMTLPAKPGTVQVVARSGPLSVTFTVTSIAAPTLLTDFIFDGVTFNANTSFGPGSILVIVGQNLASGDATASRPLPTALASTRVVLRSDAGEILLPLFSVSPAQIRALLPFDIAPGRYLLRCEADTLRSNEVEISIAALAPGIFTISGTGQGQGIFLKEDGSLVTSANPAARGSTITFYAAGLGPVNPAVAAGEAGATAEPLNRTIQTPRVFFDRYAATVLYSGLARGIAGRYEVSVQVPAAVSPATNVSVSMTIGGFTSNRVTIPVR
jgi:uncharacterized protein (TIGR03437 family)